MFLAIHLSMHSQVGNILGNVRVAQAVFMLVGALTAVLLALPAWDTSAISRLGRVPWYLFAAGAIGTIIVATAAWLIPRIGVGTMMVLMLSGQVVCGVVISHFGWWGSPTQPMSLIRGAGLLLVAIGSYLAVRGS